MQHPIRALSFALVVAACLGFAGEVRSATFELQTEPHVQYFWKGLGSEIGSEPMLMMRDGPDVIGYGYSVSPHAVTAEGWALAGTGGAQYSVGAPLGPALIARIVAGQGEQDGDPVTVYVHYKARIRNALAFTNAQAVVANGATELYRENLNIVSGDFLPNPEPFEVKIGESVSLINIGTASFSQSHPSVSVDTLLQVSFCESGPPTPPIAGEGACDNGLDDDGDGLFDLEDPGCEGELDETEYSADLPCDDGIDNDGDCLIDFGGGDPGCRSAFSSTESPKCQDGTDNDADLRIDFDGGQSLFGECSAGVCPAKVSDIDGDGEADPDPQCSAAWLGREAPPPPAGCGLGGEIAIAVSALWWTRQRRRVKRGG